MFRVESGDIWTAAGGFVGSVGGADLDKSWSILLQSQFDGDDHGEPFSQIVSDTKYINSNCKMYLSRSKILSDVKYACLNFQMYLSRSSSDKNLMPILMRILNT